MELLYNTSISTNKTKVWKVYTRDNCVIVEHGFLNGKMVIHEEYCDGKNIGKKNETTPEQQAKLHAKSLWDKKIKSGYSTNPNEKSLSFFPMLAHEYNNNIEFPCYVQPKLDGIRCIVYYKNDNIIFQSRNHSQFQLFPQLMEILLPIFNKYPDMVFDGELYNHQLSFQEITSIVRKKNHNDLFKIEYHVYDMFHTEYSFTKRFEILESIIPNNKYIKLVETIKINNDVKKYLTHFQNENYEGIMLRNPMGKYQQQTRSKDLLKYKEFKDSEYPVTGHHMSSTGFPVFECVTPEGIEFGVVMKISNEGKKDFLHNIKEYYGKKLTVKYQELTDQGVPRFPVGLGFRIDV